MKTKLWGVRRKGSDFLLSQSWNSITDEPRYDGEPIWPLLFRTRRQAKAWCKNAGERHAYLGWEYRTVRVEMEVRA